MGLCRALRRLHRRGATQYCCVGACGSEDPGNDPLHGNHGRCTWQSNSYSGLSTVGVWSGGRSPFFSVLAVVLGLYWAGKRNASYRRTTGCTRGGDRVRDDGWVTRAARVPRVVAPDGRILKRMLTENPSTPRQAPTTNPTIASPGRERAPRTAHHPVLSSCGDRGVCMLALGRDQRTDGLPRVVVVGPLIGLSLPAKQNVRPRPGSATADRRSKKKIAACRALRHRPAVIWQKN